MNFFILSLCKSTFVESFIKSISDPYQNSYDTALWITFFIVFTVALIITFFLVYKLEKYIKNKFSGYTQHRRSIENDNELFLKREPDTSADRWWLLFLAVSAAICLKQFVKTSVFLRNHMFKEAFIGYLFICINAVLLALFISAVYCIIREIFFKMRIHKVKLNGGKKNNES